MKQQCGWRMPKDEKHFVEWMTQHNTIVDGRHTYQFSKIEGALRFCSRFRTAVDVGAHIGTWSYYLAKKFRTLHAFEPVDVMVQCFAANVQSENVILHNTALGQDASPVFLSIDPFSTGGTHILRGGERGAGQWAKCQTLDHFAIEDVDFLKIDCEGFECDVIEGATDTIARCRPTVIVEQKPHVLAKNYGLKGIPAVDLLISFGYEVRLVQSGDYVLTPKVNT